ncbi:MAG: N-acyl homoserine lactonase family protein [Rhizobiales bacterium]|nr:N-acyl homoserine lactonase family protein [Hyphomicrobiales bacterium]
MKMHVLSGGRCRMRRSIYIPDADKGEMIDLPVLSMLLRHPKGNVLFDTGCHPSAASNPEERWGGLAKFMTPVMGPNDNVISGLKAVGLGPDDIDVVVCSHLHTDHCGCNEFFKRATIIVNAKELKAAKASESTMTGYVPADWENGQAMKTVDGQDDIFGDGRITLVPLPGHTVGTMGALVRLDRSGEFLLASDAVSLRVNLDQNTVPKNTKDADLFLKTFAEIRRIEAKGATIICGHDDAQWQSLRKGADAYD